MNTALPDTNYGIVATGFTPCQQLTVSSQTTNSFQIQLARANGTANDGDFSFIVIT